MKYVLSIILILLVTGVGYAQTDSVRTIIKAPESLQKLIDEITAEETNKNTKDPELEIDGLLFDETKTKSGRDFYDYFYSKWIAPVNAKNYSIFINEKPYRLTTTMIEVKINEILVFQSFLQPRGDILEELAQQAAQRTYLYLYNYEKLTRQLDGDDRSGSGIF